MQGTKKYWGPSRAEWPIFLTTNYSTRYSHNGDPIRSQDWNIEPFYFQWSQTCLFSVILCKNYEMVVRIVVCFIQKEEPRLSNFDDWINTGTPDRERNERCMECEYTWIKFVDQLSNEPVDMFRYSWWLRSFDCRWEVSYRKTCAFGNRTYNFFSYDISRLWIFALFVFKFTMCQQEYESCVYVRGMHWSKSIDHIINGLHWSWLTY